MVEDRKTRFLVAPLLFFASLGWGIIRDGSWTLGDILPGLGLKPEALPDLVALLAAGGIAVFALGYVIGTSTYVLLRLSFVLAARFGLGSGCHEIGLSRDALELVWQGVGMPGPANRRQEFFAGVAFEHGVLRCKNESVHQWLVRRWNAFSVAVTSLMALLLSLLVGSLLRIRFSTEWWIPVVLVSGVLCISAVLAWHDYMGMLRFQATRQQQPGNG